MKEYEIKHEPVVPGYFDKDGQFIKTGELKDKYNIYYYINGIFQDREFHSTDGVNGTIREGYTLKTT